jgi:hypothetical protein
METHSRYRPGQNYRFFVLGFMRVIFEDRAILRRKSKGGLGWASSSSRLFTVHFILDHLDMLAVTQKSDQRDGIGRDGQKERAITGAELRWIFHNRDDPGVRRAIQFWREGEPVGPPWEEGVGRGQINAQWAVYKPRSVV